MIRYVRIPSLVAFSVPVTCIPCPECQGEKTVYYRCEVYSNDVLLGYTLECDWCGAEFTCLSTKFELSLID